MAGVGAASRMRLLVTELQALAGLSVTNPPGVQRARASDPQRGPTCRAPQKHQGQASQALLGAAFSTDAPSAGLPHLSACCKAGLRPQTSHRESCSSGASSRLRPGNEVCCG